MNIEDKSKIVKNILNDISLLRLALPNIIFMIILTTTFFIPQISFGMWILMVLINKCFAFCFIATVLMSSNLLQNKTVLFQDFFINLSYSYYKFIKTCF